MSEKCWFGKHRDQAMSESYKDRANWKYCLEGTLAIERTGANALNVAAMNDLELRQESGDREDVVRAVYWQRL